MKPYYYWPLYAANILGVKSTRNNTWSIIRATITIFFTASIGVGCLLEAMWNWKGVETLAKVFPSFTPVLQILTKCFVYIIKQKQIEKCVDDLNKFMCLKNSNDDKIAIKLNDAKNSIRTYLTLYALMIYLSGTVYNSWPFFIRSFPYVCYQLKLFEQDLYYNIAYLWQFFSGYFIMVNLAFAFDLFLLSQVAYVYLELTLIKRRFLLLSNKDGCDVLFHQFGKLVQQHDFVLEFIKNMNGLYSNMLLLQFLSTLLAICNGTFTFVLYKNYIVFVSFVGSYLTQILIYCICGAIVMEETRSIGTTLYKASWWIDEPRIRQNVQIVIQRSQIPVRITVGNIIVLNLESFTSVMQTSYSFFALMQTMYEKK